MSTGNLKRKALKIFNTNEESEKVFKIYKNSGESQQDFFTKAAIKALTVKVKKRPKYNESESVQIRLDETIHKMLKIKAHENNVSMEYLIIYAILEGEE